MIKHVILWTLKEEANTNAVKEGIRAGLEGLLGVIPGLVALRVYTQGLESSNTHVMLDSTFDSVAALQAYAVHPAHVEVADTKVRPFTVQRSCLDFEI